MDAVTEMDAMISLLAAEAAENEVYDLDECGVGD